MVTDGYVYLLAFYRDEGTPVGQAAIDVDWEPARQWVRLLALRDGRRLDEDAAAFIQPVWHASGRPVVGAIRVRLVGTGRGLDVSHDFSVAYFREPAHEASASFVERGRLASGERFRCVALAVAGGLPDPPSSRRRFTVRAHGTLPNLSEAPLPALTGVVEIGCPDPDDAPAFVSPEVIDEITLLTRRETSVEIGGGLVGRLYRDPAARQVFIRITAQIPARHTESTAARLAFSSCSWAEMRTEVGRRGAGESLIGWWHTHIAGLTVDEGDSRSAGLRTGSSLNFFSRHDCAVHRAVFPSATSLALVASPAPGGEIELGVFGWCRGVIQSRGLRVLEG
jgi:hypothetical protein